jgi:hypothetical protein
MIYAWDVCMCLGFMSGMCVSLSQRVYFSMCAGLKLCLGCISKKYSAVVYAFQYVCRTRAMSRLYTCYASMCISAAYACLYLLCIYVFDGERESSMHFACILPAISLLDVVSKRAAAHSSAFPLPRTRFGILDEK